MSAESFTGFHILTPPVLGVVFTAFSFVDHKIIATKVRALLDTATKPFSDDAADTIERMVIGAVALATFVANALLFAMNCLVAFFIFPNTSMWKLVVTGICGIAILLTGYQIYGLGSTYHLDDIAAVKKLSITVDTWLSVEQIMFNILTVVYFIIGLSLSDS
jgi:hypothetical protein